MRHKLSNFRLTVLQFFEGIKSIPAGVTTLDLSENFIADISAAALARGLQALPANVTRLDLRSNNFSDISAAELAQILQALPTTVNSLNLSSNGLYQKRGAGLAVALHAIPRNVSVLDLSNNYLTYLTAAELFQAFQGIPFGVSTLNLSANYLCLNEGNKLALALEGIPRSVSVLNLSINALYRRSAAELVQIFHAIPDGVTTLDLSKNGLSKICTDALAQSFHSLPVTVTTLVFSDLDLLASGIQLPASVSRLKLVIDDCNSIILASILQKFIPITVFTLDLSDNDLGTLKPDELASLFAAIPPHVKRIDLSRNQLFTNKTRAEKDAILMALGDDRTRFILTSNGESDLARLLPFLPELKSNHNMSYDALATLLAYVPNETPALQTNGQSHRQIKATEKTVVQIEYTREIKRLAIQAITNYQNWSTDHNLPHRGTCGWFTFFRHGQFGRDRAAQLKLHIENGDPIAEINAFLADTKTRYNQHSLASFLLDEISLIADSPWGDREKYPKYRLYQP